MPKTLLRFVRDESGTTALEYAFIAALISVVLVGAAGNIGNTLNNTFGDVESSL
jgi:pilus assembly protein Flp/PilA